MKGKDVLAALLFGAAGCWSAWHGLYYGQAGCALAAVLLLLCACMLLFRLLKQKPDGERKGSKFVGVLIFFAIASGLAMPFVNGVLAYRPAYTYPHYYASGRIPAFPAQIPDQAADVQFRVLGEGIIGRPSFMLSFRMDPERAAALQQETELLGTPVSIFRRILRQTFYGSRACRIAAHIRYRIGTERCPMPSFTMPSH